MPYGGCQAAVPAPKVSKQKTAERIGSQRTDFAWACLQGKCGRSDVRDLVCTACHQGYHGSTCFSLGQGHLLRAKGSWVCPSCTNKGLAEGGEQTDEQRETAERALLRASVDRMTFASPGTVNGDVTVDNHLTAYAKAAGYQVDAVVKSPAGLVAFGEWLTDKSTITAQATVEAYVRKAAMRGIPDAKVRAEAFGDGGELAAFLKCIQKRLEAKERRDTALSGGMFGQLLKDSQTDRSKPLLRSRDRLSLLEGVPGGARCAEQSEWLATNTAIYEDGAAPRVEILVEETKAGGHHEQYVVLPAWLRTSKIDVVKEVRAHAEAWNIPEVYDEERRCHTFDHYYLRVSLAGFKGKPEEVAALTEAIAKYSPGLSKEVREDLIRRIGDRADGAEPDRWLPVQCGRHAACELAAERWREARRPGGEAFELKVVGAPMLHATLGGGRRPGIMPWSKGAIYDTWKAKFTEVYQRMKREGRDSELPVLRQGDELKLATHSMRRGGMHMARNLQGRSGVDEDAFDAQFRWDEAARDAVMRLRYGGEAAAIRRIRVVEWF